MFVQRLEVADDGVDIDVEGGDDKKEVEKKSTSGIVEEVEVEEFFVKYKNLWVSETDKNHRMLLFVMLVMCFASVAIFVTSILI